MYTVQDQLFAEEGKVPHAYQDHLGYWTIGVGRLIDQRKGGGLTDDEIYYLLTNDIARIQTHLGHKIPWWTQLNKPRQAVIVGMAFQMGIEGLLAFKNTLRYIQAGMWQAAANNMLKSLWAKQTPERAERMAKQMETGEWQFKPGFEPESQK